MTLSLSHDATSPLFPPDPLQFTRPYPYPTPQGIELSNPLVQFGQEASDSKAAAQRPTSLSTRASGQLGCAGCCRRPPGEGREGE
jgi:hypothetical protein